MQPIVSYYLLNDKGIREALEIGNIAVSPAPTDDQYQSGSLDVRIAEVRVFSP